jgi:hypothetical protein
MYVNVHEIHVAILQLCCVGLPYPTHPSCDNPDHEVSCITLVQLLMLAAGWVLVPLPPERLPPSPGLPDTVYPTWCHGTLAGKPQHPCAHNICNTQWQLRRFGRHGWAWRG